MPNYNAKGRPKVENPRKNYVTVKMTDEEKTRLDEAARLLDTTKTRVIVEGVDRIYNEAAAKAWKAQQRKEAE